jgi:hypothetical protein
MKTRPFLPGEDRRDGVRPSDYLVRAILACAQANLGENRGIGAERLAAEMWPGDEPTRLVLRAATEPATTGTSGWASELAASTTSDLVLTLGPTAAAGELFRLGTALAFGQTAQINLPGIVSASTDVAWVAQGSPMPIRQLSVGSGAALTPKKLAAGFVVSRELVEHSVPNAEKLLRACLAESVGAALDAAVFDASAASASRPAGLRNSVSVTAATSGGSDAAMMKDLGALAQAVAGVAGMSIAFVASPAAAVKIALRAGPEFRFPVLASNGLAAGFVMAVALPALASAVDPAVRIDASAESLVHMEDTTPLQIGVSATPNTVSAPTRSLFQTDAIGFRIILEASWGLRAANAVSWTEAITW